MFFCKIVFVKLILSKTKKIISNSQKVSINSQIDIKLAKGEIVAKVTKRKGWSVTTS